MKFKTKLAAVHYYFRVGIIHTLQPAHDFGHAEELIVMSTTVNNDCTAKTAFNTYVHIVPHAQNHAPEGKVSSIVEVLENKKTIFLNNPHLEEKSQHFAFDHCVRRSLSSKPGEDSPEDVIWPSLCAQVMKNSFDGVNSYLLSYGQLGTSSFMFDKNGTISTITQSIQKHGADMKVDGFHVKCSMVELYGEKLTDLLEPANSGKLICSLTDTTFRYFIFNSDATIIMQ